MLGLPLKQFRDKYPERPVPLEWLEVGAGLAIVAALALALIIWLALG
jgi:hypothetical protein